MWGLKPDHPRVGMRPEWPQDDDEAIQHWKLQKANEKFERTHNLRLDAVPGTNSQKNYIYRPNTKKKRPITKKERLKRDLLRRKRDLR